MGLIDEQEEKRAGLGNHERDRLTGFGTQTDASMPASAEEIQNMRIQRIINRLDYHAPSRTQIPRYQAIRDAAKAFVTTIVRNTPAFCDADGAAQPAERVGRSSLHEYRFSWNIGLGGIYERKSIS